MELVILGEGPLQSALRARALSLGRRRERVRVPGIRRQSVGLVRAVGPVRLAVALGGVRQCRGRGHGLRRSGPGHRLRLRSARTGGPRPERLGRGGRRRGRPRRRAGDPARRRRPVAPASPPAARCGPATSTWPRRPSPTPTISANWLAIVAAQPMPPSQRTMSPGGDRSLGGGAGQVEGCGHDLFGATRGGPANCRRSGAASSLQDLEMSVRNGPAEIALTRTLGPYSWAMDRVMALRAALAPE